MVKTLLACMLALAIVACEKETTLKEFNGSIEDYTGRLDGCGYVIQLDNGTKLEPVKNSSGEAITPGRRIAIKYRVRAVPSICMIGQTIEIISLRYL